MRDEGNKVLGLNDEPIRSPVLTGEKGSVFTWVWLKWLEEWSLQAERAD